MERHETYKGCNIRVVTSNSGIGKWRAVGELLEDNGKTLQSDLFASEPEAYQAALSAAMTEIDSRRERTGKP
jgi:hypothetical protein